MLEQPGKSKQETVIDLGKLKIQQELKGMSNLDLDSLKIKKSIATTRSFEKPISDLGKLKERVSTFSLSCAEKLRNSKGPLLIWGQTLTSCIKWLL